MKKFFSVTKLLWIGGIMGLLQQVFGDLDGIIYGGGKSYFSFSGMMNTFTIYAAIILLIIVRDAAPKHQFRDVILYFIGLDLFYYIYQIIGEYIYSCYLNPNAMTQEEINLLYLDLFKDFTYNFVYWTSIGLAAAVWALVATKLRNSGKKKLYVVMLLPLFAVIVTELLVFTYGLILFAITEYKIAHNIVSADEVHVDCTISNALLSLVMLVICLKKYLKKPAIQENTNQG